MSGRIGGTSFNLSLNVPDFQRQFTAARAAASAGSAEIGTALNEITASAERNANQVYNTINRVIGRGGSLSRYRELRTAADEASKAIDSFSSGQSEQGFSELNKAATSLERTLHAINTRTEKYTAMLGGKDNSVAVAALKYYSTQATSLRNAQDSVNALINQSSNKLSRVEDQLAYQERRQQEIAINAIRSQNINYIKAAEKQLENERRVAEKLINDERVEREKRLFDVRRNFVRQLHAEERNNVPQTRTSDVGSTLLTGLGIGSGAQVAATAINQIQNLLRGLQEGAIDFNDVLDQSTIAWTTFTGNAEKAKAQVQELFNFAKITPFTFAEVDSAARLLSAFGGAAFASTENLRLLGNVAAGTKQPLNNIAYEFGQIYTEIENGLPFGRAARALVQFGALTGETRVRLEEMQAAGVDASLMLELLYKDLGRFGGQIEAQSKTLSGGLTTFKDSLQALEAIAARPGFEKLKETLNNINKALNSQEALQAAQFIAATVAVYVNGIQELFIGAKAVFLGVKITAIDSAHSIVGAINYITHGAVQAQLDGLNALKTQNEKDATDFMNEVRKTGADFKNSVTDLFSGKWKETGAKAGQDFSDGWRDQLKKTLSDIQGELTIRSQYAGLNASRAFVAGFNSENFNQLKDLSDITANAIFGSKSSGKLKGDAEKLIADVRPLLVQAVDDIRQYGRIADGTFMSGNDNLNNYTDNVQKLHDTLGALKSALPPDAFNAVNDYLRSIEQLSTKETLLSFATAHLTKEQERLTAVQKDVAAAVALANKEVDAATAIAEKNAKVYQDNLDSLSDALSTLQEEAKNSAAAWDATLKGLKQELEGLQSTADANAKKFAAMLEPLKKEQERLATITKQNQDIYNAVLTGTTQEYLRQNEILSEQTRQIAAKWEAEIGGKRRALEGANSKVDALEKKERREVLDLDERIRSARAAHNNAQVVALELEKKRLQDRYKYQLDIERERAAVANDAFDDATKKLTKEQKDQEEKDKKNEEINKKQIDAITEQAKAQKELDDAAIAAKNEQIKQVQTLAEADKAAYADRITQIENEQKAVEKRKKTQEEEDKNRTDAAKAHLKEIKDQGDLDIEYAKDRVDAAKKVADSAKDELDAQKKITDTIKERMKFIQEENDAYLQRINAWRANAGLPPLTWAQILAGNYPQQDGGGGARGIGEGRQNPTDAASGAPSSTPTVPSTSPSGTGVQHYRINPNIPSAASYNGASYSDTVIGNTNNKTVRIGALHLFSGANISKEIDVDQAAIRAGNILLQELNAELVTGGSV